MALEDTVYIIIGIVVALVFVFWLIMDMSYKNRVRIKEVVNGRTVIVDKRAKFYEDKDKSAWWKIAGERRKTHKLIPVPPDECVEINNKGKKYVECYRFESGEVLFIKDHWKIAEPPIFDIEDMPKKEHDELKKEKDPVKIKALIDRWKKKELHKWKKEMGVITPYQPVTTNQRMGYFNNIKKSEARKADSFMKNIVPITAISSLVIIVLALLIFWGEIAQPALQGNQQALEAKQIDLQILQELNSIKTGQQRIQSQNDELIQNNAAPD